ncbi:MAG: hypothetical protein OXF26_00790 [Alphaproteobacteria bacterium]|nr:hypothetical protein [Alphaproteobacteria bacterium]MCY4229428.1 hypothetical protein [Alphaproteobacteria bacterium]MCY4318819.1 hypothetical protein [Alphaproteobacteria bacterium]
MTYSGGKPGKRPCIPYGIETSPYTVELRAVLAPEVNQEIGLA